MSIHYRDLNEFVIVAPDGYYLSAPLGPRELTVTAGSASTPLETFDLERNRPDIVLKRLGFASKELLDVVTAMIKWRRTQIGGPNPAAAGPRPSIAFTTPPPAISNKHRLVSAHARLQCHAHERLQHHGRLIEPGRGEWDDQASAQNGHSRRWRARRESTRRR